MVNISNFIYFVINYTENNKIRFKMVLFSTFSFAQTISGFNGVIIIISSTTTKLPSRDKAQKHFSWLSFPHTPARSEPRQPRHDTHLLINLYNERYTNEIPNHIKMIKRILC